MRTLYSATAVAALLALTACSDDTETANQGADTQSDGHLAADAGADVQSADDAAGPDVAPIDTGAPDPGPPLTLAVCQGKTFARYDPVAGTSFDAFPDDWLTRAAPDRATGLAPQLDVAHFPYLAGLPEGFRKVFADLGRLDGWGTSADLFARFSGPLGKLPSGAASSVNSGAMMLIRVDDGVRIPFEATTTDDNTTVLVRPMVPLRPATRHALIITNALTDSSGACIAPSAGLKKLLEGRTDGDERADWHVARLRTAAKAAKVEPKDVAAILAFTTQSTVDDSVAAAEHIAKLPLKWADKPTCKPSNGVFIECERPFVATDFRTPSGRIDPKSSKTWQLSARIWLPANKPGPWPTVIYGHGLGSGRSQGAKLADLAAPLGVATIAIDALKHQDHPSGGGKGTFATLLGFFAIDAVKMSFDFLALRDHFRQSTYEKLQLVRLLELEPDLDGDGKSDIAGKDLGYIGVSLGGIMGPELLALTERIGLAVLSVPGAKVSSIIQSSEQFGVLIYAFKPEGTTDGDVDRFFPVLQTLLDAGDPAAYAPHVLHDRLKPGGTTAPHLLMQMAIGDEIVPNIAARALARALEIPHAGTVLQPISLLPKAPALPYKANLPGAKTAGLFQFDRCRDDVNAKLEASQHGNVPASAEAFEQDSRFLAPWLTGGAAELVDPYLLLKTPPLGK